MGMHAQHDHTQPWVLPNGLGSDFDAVELRHGDVKDSDVGLERLAKIQGLSSVTCLAHDLNAGLVLEQCPQAAPDNVVVIR
jgi:hypothetical protein